MNGIPTLIIKTCFAPHENGNLIFPIMKGVPITDLIWVWRPSPKWKMISRKIYLKKLREFRADRKETMIALGKELAGTGQEVLLVFGVKNNQAPSLWEMVNTWRKHGPRNFDRSI